MLPRLREVRDISMLASNDLLAAHPGNRATLSSQVRSTADVRAAIRRRTARRDQVIRLSVVAALLGAVLGGAYKLLL
jgi:hypothetical protein